MKVKVVNIDPLETQADYRAQADGAVKARFNSSFHTADEAEGWFVNSTNSESKPKEKPYSFSRWLPLILRSRGLAASDAQFVRFSPSQTRLLLQVADASIQTGVINRMYREDIDDEIMPSFKELTFPSEGLFMRLEACSAKDGQQKPQAGEARYGPYSTYPKKPGGWTLRSVPEILLLFLTSTRARNALFHAIEDESPAFELIFLPYNDRMHSRKEYRVFCPPFHSTDSLRITAISLYRWYESWYFGWGTDERREWAIERVSQACETISKQIAAELDVTRAMDVLLMQQGFTFDVFFDDERDDVQLVELNVFGPRSGCGSCLFHWINDKQTLAGHGDPEHVEFRVSYQKIIDRQSSDEEDESSQSGDEYQDKPEHT